MKRVLCGAAWDTFRMWMKLETAFYVLVAIRVLWRWTRVPLREREQLLWMKFMYEVVSGYGEGEIEHVFAEAGQRYPNWHAPTQSSHREVVS